VPTKDPKQIIDYLNNKKNKVFDDNDSINLAVENSPQEFVSKSQTDSLSSSITDKLKDSPLQQLGEDFISEQVSKVGGTLLDNAQRLIGDKLDEVNTRTEKAINLAFSSITAAITAKNDILMFFVQQVGQQILDRLKEKEAVRAQMEESLRQLYNALTQLVAGDPFFKKYLIKLRRALQLMYSAQKDIIGLRNTYVVTDVFRSNQYDSALNLLQQAEALIEPQGKQTDKPFTDKGLFANIGIPSEPQQLVLMLSIPKLAKEVILATKGYFQLTAQINGLLVAFSAALSTLSAVSSSKLKNYTVGILDSVNSSLESLNQAMAKQLNGGVTSFLEPNAGFKPESVKVSQNALGWLIQLKTIISQLQLLPKDSLKDLQLDKTATSNYEKAVAKIKALKDIKRGDAVLKVNEGQEQIGLMETQITQFCLAALGALVNGTIADNVLPLGRSVISYLKLSRENDNAIKNAITPFVGSKLPAFDAINRIGGGIYDMLDQMGLDKGADLLRTGQFSDFFSLTTRTATYAGYALATIGELKQCVNKTENVNVLERAEREITSDAQNSELLLQTSAQSSLKEQKSENDVKIDELDRLKDDVKKAPAGCIVDESGSFNGDALVERFGGVLGVNLLTDSFGSDKLKKVAQGRI